VGQIENEMTNEKVVTALKNIRLSLTQLLEEIEPKKKFPEPKFKEGDKVWDKEENRVAFFYSYSRHSSSGVYVTYEGATEVFVRSHSDIEPYTGQDKPPSVQELVDMIKKQPIKIVPLFPYTVILKSGVKVGVDEATIDELIKYIVSLGGELSGVSESAIFTSKEHSFTVSEIAAIVPTESIVA
jgi:hypothetical protein